MNYIKIYSRIIRYRKNNKLRRKNNEQHHIVPASMGGSNKPHNRVNLTPKEHYICHLLLTKIVKKDSPAYYSMIYAWNMMSSFSDKHSRYKMSKGSLYQKLKREFSKARSISIKGEKNPSYNKMWIRNLKTKESKKIHKDDKIPIGWEKGRYSDNINRKYITTIVNMINGKTTKLYDTNSIPLLYRKGKNYNHLLKMDILKHYKNIAKKIKEGKKRKRVNHNNNKVIKKCKKTIINYNNYNNPDYIKTLFDSYLKCKNFKEFSIKNNFNNSAKALYKIFNIHIPDYDKYKRNNKKKVIIDGITYNSHTEAVKNTKISMECIIKYKVNGVFNRNDYEKNCYRCGIIPRPPLTK